MKYILLMLILFSAIYSSCAPVFSQDKKIPVSPQTLFKRFDNKSSSDTFILVKIYNKKTKEQCKIVIENSSWRYTCRYNHIIPPKIMKGEADENYAAYMTRNHNKTFIVSDEVYKEYKMCSYDDTVFADDVKKGLAFMAKKFLDLRLKDEKKQIIDINTFKNEYYFSEKKRFDNIKVADFFGAFLEAGAIVRRQCYSGLHYIEGGEVNDALYEEWQKSQKKQRR